MKTEKEVYSAPKAKCFEVHLSETILQGSVRPDSVFSGYDDNNDLGAI
jgi:hypothetical protein